MSNLSILYIGSLDKRSNSFRRFKTIQSLYPNSEAIDTDPFILNKYFIRLQHHLNIGPGIFLLNQAIWKKLSRNVYDIILVDNKPYLTRSVLTKIKKHYPNIKIANLLTDDPFGKFSSSWRLFKKTAKLYDIAFVQREVNIQELKNIGVKHVATCYRSYDPDYNRPIQLHVSEMETYHTEVGFVGSYEEPRASFIAYLIQNGIPVQVTGAGWVDQPYWKIIKPYYKAPFVYGDDYIKTLCGMDIALHFLRHANRDEQDSRTFEIPSCGTFMLAERSGVHESLFTDGQEAVFFETKEELLSKVIYYLKRVEEREKIAKAGLERCKTSGYSHSDRMQYVINQILNL